MLDLALMSASFLDREWEQALEAAVQADIGSIEACGGGHIPTHHFDPVALSADAGERARFAESLARRELHLAALSCHGNPLDPDEELAEKCHRDFEASCVLAEQLGIGHINLLAGLPGGSPTDRTPNWIIPSVVPDFREAYTWQWDERVLPYWTAATALARDSGVRLCIEPHPATVVYNLETFERLRGEVGPTVGMNWDHSHLWWQGIDPIALVERCADAIYTVHIKDTIIRRDRVAVSGVLSAADHFDPAARPWHFGTPGYGHSEHEWGAIVMALRAAGYSGALFIECEDPTMRPEDTLAKSAALLRRVVPAGDPPAPDWAAAAAEPRETRARHDA